MSASRGSDERYFISYSRVDAADFVIQLAGRLVAGPPSHPVWLDVHDARPAMDWDDQIRDAIQACKGLLFVMTPDSLHDHSMAKPEWVWALRCKKPVIPLRVDAAAELPFRLSSRQYVDFSDGFEAGLARLRGYLAWVGSPEWVLQDLRYQLTEAERELPRAAPDQRPRIMQDVQQFQQRIADQSRLVADPQAAQRRTEERIAAGLEQQRQPERPVAPPSRAKFVNPRPVFPGYFQDRQVETEQLGEFLRTADERIMTLVGRGGVGKTAIAGRLLQALENGVLPDDLGEFAVDGIVYLSPAGDHPVSFSNLFADLCRLLPQETADLLMQRYREPKQTPAALMRALLDAFPAGRFVVLLDNAEDVIDTSSEDFRITDTALDEGLQALLAAPAHGVKVIMTTRVAPRGLLLASPERQRRLDLDEGLPSPYAERMLRARDPDGRLGLKHAPDDLLDRARQRTRGYPRALEALAAILAADRDTTLPELLAETARLPGNVVEVLVGTAFSRLDPLAQQVMQALAIYTAPVPPVAVDYLLQPYMPAVDAAPVLSRLVNMQFVRREAGRYALHQVDRDYALGRIPAGEAADRDADPTPFTRQALRYRGADYFEQARKPREEWKSLEDLAPQLAEFELRCQAEDYETAAQVLLAIDEDYLLLWGHYRLIIDMHEQLQDRLEDPGTTSRCLSHLGNAHRSTGRIGYAIELFERALEIDETGADKYGQGYQLRNLGICYAVLGRLPEAMELFEQALAIDRSIGSRMGAAYDLGTLGVCYLYLGRVSRALELQEQALAISREVGDRENEAIVLGNLGDCLQSLGRPREAIGLYEQLLTICRELGFRFCEAQGLAMLGNACGSIGEWDRAIGYCRQAAAIADAIGDIDAQSTAYLSLAWVYLLTGDMPSAQRAALSAVEHGLMLDKPDAQVMAGIAGLRQEQPAVAAKSFRDAVRQAGELLHQSGDMVAARDAKALALCGLALISDRDLAIEAEAEFRFARAITSVVGVVEHTLALFDVLAGADHDGILTGVRPAAAGTDEC
jgi:tetratricopeptide (TPR) repeat protein